MALYERNYIYNLIQLVIGKPPLVKNLKVILSENYAKPYTPFLNFKPSPRPPTNGVKSFKYSSCQIFFKQPQN